jgi:hypothetical protein
MKKFIVIVLGTVLLGNSTYSQKNTWSIGFRTAFRVERIIVSAYYSSGNTFPPMAHHALFIGMPPTEINLSYHITDRLSLQTGIAYYQYQIKKRKSMFYNILEEAPTDGSELFRSLQVPLLVRYDIPLRKTGFSFFVQTGLVLDILFANQYYAVYDRQIVAMLGRRCLRDVKVFLPKSTRVGVSLNGGFGFAYRFKKGWQISLSGEYNIADASRGGELNAHIDIYDESTLQQLENGGETRKAKDYLDIGLGVSYTFKRKTKE